MAKTAGVIEAKREGATLTGVEIQSAKQFIREHQDKITVLKTTNGNLKSSPLWETLEEPFAEIPYRAKTQGYILVMRQTC